MCIELFAAHIRAHLVNSADMVVACWNPLSNKERKILLTSLLVSQLKRWKGDIPSGYLNGNTSDLQSQGSNPCPDKFLLALQANVVNNLQVEVFWVVTPCSVVVGYQHFRGPYCLHLLGCDAV